MPTWCARARTTTWRRSDARAHAPRWRTWMSRPANSASPSWSPPKSPARSNNWARAKCCSPAICPCSPAKTRGNRASCAPNSKTGSSRRDYADRTLRDHFKLLSLDGCGLAEPPGGGGRGGRDSALPARHAARRARPPGPAHVLRSRRFHGAGRRHRAQPGTDRAALRRRCGRHADAGHRARRARPDA